MKRTLIAFSLLMALATALYGCASEDLLSLKDSDEAMQNGGDVPIGGPSNIPEDDGGIAVEDEDEDAAANPSAPGAKKPAAKKKSKSESSTSSKVTIVKNSDTFGNLILGEDFIPIMLMAKGGSGKYAWEMTGQPEGTSLESTDSNKAYFKGNPSKMGEFKLKLTVSDASDATKTDSREISVNVAEDIAINLYKKTEDGKTWGKMEPTAAKGIVMPPYEWLRLKVISKAGDDKEAEKDAHGDKYTWYIAGKAVSCNQTGCDGTYDGLIITSIDPDTKKSVGADSVMFLYASEDFIGKEIKNIEISAMDNFKNEAKLEINSLVFEQDPCKTPLDAQGNIEGNIEKTSHYGKDIEVEIPVKGGNGKLTWTLINALPEGMEFEPGDDGRKLIISGKIDATDGMSIDSYVKGETLEFQFSVVDECSTKNETNVNLSINVTGNPATLKIDPKDYDTTLRLGANDTDGSTKMKLYLSDEKNNAIGEWEDFVGLNQYGDGQCGWFCYDINANHFVSQPPTKFSEDRTIDEIAKVRFYILDPGSGGWVDIKINKYEITLGDWFGTAIGANKDKDDREDKSYLDYNIAWTYKAPTT